MQTGLRSRFLKYTLQSMAGMIGISVYILADTFFISVYSGADGLAVLNLILPVYGLIYATGSMIGIGSATRYGIKRAQGEHTDHYFGQSLLWSVLASIPFVLAGIIFPDQLLRLLGADAGLIELGRNYLRIIMIASPFFMSDYTFTAFARNDNAPMTAMFASIAGSMFNIVFDYIFMFPMGLGFPGAALATAFCPIITMSVCCIHYLGKSSRVVFRLKKPSIKHCISCCKLGVSAFVGEMSSAVITIIFNMLILHIAGNIGVAAYGIIANMSMVVMSVLNGLAQGAQPLVSENYGRNNSAAVKKILQWSILTCLLLEGAVIACAWWKTDALIGIFNRQDNVQLLDYAHIGLRLYVLGFVFAGVNIILVAYFSAVDRARTAIVGSVMRGVAAIIPCAVIMAQLFHLNGVWLSFLASETVTFLVILIMAGRRRK